MPNDIFLGIIFSSPAIRRCVPENEYAEAKEQMADASEKDRLEAVFRSRVYPKHPRGIIFYYGPADLQLLEGGLASLEDYVLKCNC